MVCLVQEKGQSPLTRDEHCPNTRRRKCLKTYYIKSNRLTTLEIGDSLRNFPPKMLVFPYGKYGGCSTLSTTCSAFQTYSFNLVKLNDQNHYSFTGCSNIQLEHKRFVMWRFHLAHTRSYDNEPSSTFASFKSTVSYPSVNQL